MSQRIKAFTLPELMIVMVLTGLTTAMTFAAYRYIDRHFVNFSISQKGLMEYKEFAVLFKAELDKSNFATASHNSVHVFFDDRTIKYHIYDDFIVRDQIIRTDTFQVKISNYRFLFFDEGQKILNGLQIEAKYKEEEIQFLFLKQYDTFTLFQLQEEDNLWD